MAANSNSHPPGLYLLFLTEMWERFSYYGNRAILTLFMVKALLFDKAYASSIYGSYTGLVYLTPLLGGYIADRYWGNRRSILVGGIMMAMAQFCLFLSASFFEQKNMSMPLFFLGLGLLIFGNGFFKPNISTMVGSLYPPNDKRLDAAFTIFYMGINLGAFFAPLVCGTLGDTGNPADFKYGFLSACVGMLVGTLTFELFKNKYIVDSNGKAIGLSPKASRVEGEASKVDAPLTKEDKERIAVIFILSFFVIFFWAAFEQAGASLTFFADEQTDRSLFGWTVPTSYFQSINPIAIIVFATPLAFLWGLLGKKNIEPSSPLKMAIGLFLLAIGYLVIAFGVKGLEPGVKVSMLWLVSTYSIHTVGELCLSPIGLSMVNKLSPAKFSSLLMGVWFLSTAAANKFGGLLSALYPPSDGDFVKATEKGINLKEILAGKITATAEQIAMLKEMGLAYEFPSILGFTITNLNEFFMIFVVMAGVAALILFLTYRKLLKMMHGVQ